MCCPRVFPKRRENLLTKRTAAKSLAERMQSLVKRQRRNSKRIACTSISGFSPLFTSAIGLNNFTIIFADFTFSVPKWKPLKNAPGVPHYITAVTEDSRYYDLYVTAENHIADVAHQTLNRMANFTSAPVQHPSSFRNGLLNPDSGGWWTSRGGVIHEPGSDDAQNLFSSLAFTGLAIWPEVPVTMPENPKKSRKTTLKDIWPKVAVLKRLGIREQEKLAKIIYNLHPFLTDEEVGRFFPAKSGTRRSKGTDRDRGRILLGKKKPKKTTP